MDRLPPEILHTIGEKLPGDDITNIIRVNKKTIKSFDNNINKDAEFFWKKRYNKEFGEPENKDINYKREYLKKLNTKFYIGSDLSNPFMQVQDNIPDTFIRDGVYTITQMGNTVKTDHWRYGIQKYNIFDEKIVKIVYFYYNGHNAIILDGKGNLISFNQDSIVATNVKDVSTKKYTLPNYDNILLFVTMDNKLHYLLTTFSPQPLKVIPVSFNGKVLYENYVTDMADNLYKFDIKYHELVPQNIKSTFVFGNDTTYFSVYKGDVYRMGDALSPQSKEKTNFFKKINLPIEVNKVWFARSNQINALATFCFFEGMDKRLYVVKYTDKEFLPGMETDINHIYSTDYKIINMYVNLNRPANNIIAATLCKCQ